MSPGQVAIDLWMLLVAVSLVSIVAFFVVAAVAAVATATRNRARRVSAEVAELSRWCSPRELAEIDKALDRVLAEDRGLLL